MGHYRYGLEAQARKRFIEKERAKATLKRRHEELIKKECSPAKEGSIMYAQSSEDRLQDVMSHYEESMR